MRIKNVHYYYYYYIIGCFKDVNYFNILILKSLHIYFSFFLFAYDCPSMGWSLITLYRKHAKQLFLEHIKN